MKHHTQWDDSQLTFSTTLWAPTGWTKRFDASSSPSDFWHYVRNDAISSIGITMPIKRRFLATAQFAAGRGVFSWDKIDNDQNRADVECLSIYSARGNLDTGAFLVARGSTSATTAYYGGFSPAGAEIRIAKVVAGTPTDLDTDSFTVTAGQSYWVRFRVEGTNLSLKVWAVGDEEPSTWTLTATDSAISAAGFVGTWNEGDDKQGAWNFFACATDGDTAVRPITNDEYTAWLESQDVHRCVIAEMSATGFSPATSDFTKSVPYYISNTGYVSHEQDTPANRSYPSAIARVPTFRREMGAALRGRASVGFGDLVVRNPRATMASGGIRDRWLRQKWNKSVVSLYLGDPSWPRHDFRPYMVGRLLPPSAPTPEEIVFPMREMTEAFSDALQTNVFSGSSNFDGAYLPLTIGAPTYVEPPLYDTANLKYKLHDGAITDFILADPTSLALVYDNGATLSAGPFTVAAVDTTFEWITTNVATGVLVNYVVVFTSGTPPAPLALNTKYYVSSIFSTTQFTLSATRGGGNINLTGTTTGATLYVHGFECDTTNGVLQLVTTPSQSGAGRIVVKQVKSTVSAGARIANMIEWVIFTKYGLSTDYQDDVSLSALETALSSASYDSGIWLGKDRHTVAEVLDEITAGSSTWYGTNQDGAIQVGQLDLPSSTAVMAFSEGDIAAESLRQTGTILPIDFSKADITAAPVWLSGGQYLVGGVNIAPYPLEKYDYGAVGTPIDTPAQGDAQPKQTFDLIFPRTGGALEQARLATLFEKQIGVFSFRTRLTAIELKIGDTIQLTHPREGWKTYTADDPPGPDNPAPFDATKAVVIGIDANLSGDDPFKIALKVFRQLPQHAPESADDMPAPVLQMDYATGTLVPTVGSATVTFTRATDAWVTDWEGLVRKAKSGEARFRGLRRVENLAATTSEDFSNAAWTKTSVTVSGGGSTLTASGANGEVTQALTIPASSGNGSYRVRVKLTRVTGSGNVQIRIGATYKTVAVDATPTVFTSDVVASSGTSLTWGLRIVTSSDAVTAEEIQLEDVSGQANQAPAEYVSVGVESAPYHGAAVDGVKYFDRQNGNTVASNVVTEAEGAAISRVVLRGLHREPAATNTVTAGRDLTNVAWTPVTATMARDQVGVDGRTGAATKMTATAPNAVIVQVLAPVTLAVRTLSVYLKRITGTGVVAITMDGGATFTDVTSLINSSNFTRVQMSQNLANRTIAVALGTSGDAVAIDFVQEELAAVTGSSFLGSSPIDSAIAATRNADSLSYASTALDKAQGVQYAELSPDISGNSSVGLYAVTTEASDEVGLLAQTNTQTATGYLGANRATKASALTADDRMKWVHRWDAEADEVFVNGVRGSAAAGSSYVGSSTTLYVGQNAAGTGSGCAIGRVAVWNVPVDLDQLLDLST